MNVPLPVMASSEMIIVHHGQAESASGHGSQPSLVCLPAARTSVICGEKHIGTS